VVGQNRFNDLLGLTGDVASYDFLPSPVCLTHHRERHGTFTRGVPDHEDHAGALAGFALALTILARAYFKRRGVTQAFPLN
jgi:hypothetical protein